MLEFDRIHISEEIDLNKTNKSKECSFVIIGIFYIRASVMDHILVIVVII